MKYNRASIIRNETTEPILMGATKNGDDYHWLIESQETFHGEHDDNYFYFKDSRIPGCLKLPMDCIELEFLDEDLANKE